MCQTGPGHTPPRVLGKGHLQGCHLGRKGGFEDDTDQAWHCAWHIAGVPQRRRAGPIDRSLAGTVPPRTKDGQVGLGPGGRARGRCARGARRRGRAGARSSRCVRGGRGVQVIGRVPAPRYPVAERSCVFNALLSI